MEKDAPHSSNKPTSKTNASGDKPSGGYASSNAPQISLPKGGGAIKSIDEKFSVNAANGTAGFSIPFPFSPSRNGFMPAMGLAYNSGSGNGAFGLGWNAEPAAIARRTDKKFPEYKDDIDSDSFIFSGAEDLVPVYNKDRSGNWIKDSNTSGGVTVTRYRPRTEGAFARIEKITEVGGNVYWKATSPSNVISIFGKSTSAQVFDPLDPTKIFKWLLEFSFDDKGNCFQYEYKKEDKVNVPHQLHEKNRLNDFSKCTNIYLKRIKYCNKTHFNSNSIDYSNWESFLNNLEYLLELVLDYGEHDFNNPQPNDDKGWLCRTDAFSDYRAGFEIRTYRLCYRILMFHRFSELGTTACLVRSTDIEYDALSSNTFLQSVTQKGYIRKADGTYSQKSLPPIELSYEPLGWNTELKSLPLNGMANLPVGIDEREYQWVDLYKEGVPGILTEQAGAWHYKSNSGDGNFEGIKLISSKPSMGCICAGTMHFADIEARGQQFLVSNDLNGYFQLNDDNEWMPFKNFTTTPNINLRDPNLKYIDLNGDGMADILISEETLFTWYEGKGKEGFNNHKTLSKVLNEEQGPNMIFADTTESIILADMSGDGLMDIVRIRHSEVSYWPNLGYGRFGAKVNMSNAPVFDNEENFNPRFIKLADIDGSGTTDIVYLGHNSFKVYFNQSGNSWSESNTVGGTNPIPFPSINEHNNISIIDLLGNGTGCIVWSSPLPGQHLLYVDLMGGKKPYVMTSYRNNMGKEVNMEYKPSTFYYLQDKKAGTPWITKLHFPVQCVNKVEMIDLIAKTRFTTQYSYHHGYYDHPEREFRGFGRVDQIDTEDFDQFKKHSNPNGSIQIIDEGFHEPPILTKSWFNTGAFLDKEKILTQFAHEYYNNNITPEKELADPSLPADLTVDEWREAFRSCKGTPLRIEVYSLDGSDKQAHPYTTSHSSCLIQLLQPRLKNSYAVFMVQQSEGLTYSYERNPADPRIEHSMVIETDNFGNVLKSATITYGRKTLDSTLTSTEQAEQSKTHIVFSQHTFTNAIDDDTTHRLPSIFDSLNYELTGFLPAVGEYFSIDEINDGFDQSGIIPYESQPTEGIKQKRLIEQERTVFLSNDMNGPLALGVMESLGLPYQSYKLSLTPSLLDFIFGTKVSDDLLMNEGKFIHFDDNNYWIRSGTQTLDASNFYQVTATTDPFGFTTNIQYDTNYRFFVQKTTDALNNQFSVLGFNYRMLSAYLMKDLNDNRAGARIDELGMVTGTFSMGKEGETKGDLMDTSSVEASANDKPGSIMEYFLFDFMNTGKPGFIKNTVYETHYSDTIQSGLQARSQLSYSYTDGGGQILMQKKQAEPGIALQENEDGTISEIDTTPNFRWIGNGRRILNNKGKTVKQYEAYFSTSFEFEDSKQLVERGITAFITYDAAGRVIRTDLPNGTFTKTVFDSWTQFSFDLNDTVLESQWYNDRITTPVSGLATPEEIAAANKSAIHANTPLVNYLDSLGRNFLSIEDNGAEGKYKTLTQTDIEGNVRAITDARGNIVMQYKYDMLGAQLYRTSMDASDAWMLNDVMGKPIYNWDSRNNVFRAQFDALHRPTKVFVRKGSSPEINRESITYGEGVTNDKQLNLRGRLYQHFDEAGIITDIAADFKGNSLQSSRQLCSDYKNDIDWSAAPVMEPTVYISSAVFDALNRPITLISADQSVLIPGYSDANLLVKIDVQLRGDSQKTPFVQNITYDARGQRESIVYGNNTVTNYQYDNKTLRLSQLLTTGKNGTDLLQKLQYTYDPSGNITSIKDQAQQTLFFNNSVVDPSSDFVYDAIYRLITASSREHIGQNQPPSPHDEFRTNLPTPGDSTAMRNYTQRYHYDAVGNILQMIHAAGAGSWTRTYDYETINNRLKSNTVNSVTENYTYDQHGNITSLMQLQGLTWNCKDQLQNADLGGGGIAYYVYDGTGRRMRKVIERQGGIKEDRIYLGGVEFYRKIDGSGTLQEATDTLHIMDDKRRISMIETKTVKNGASSLEQLIRYQYSNQIDSSSLELDDNGTIISHEEYYPFGATSYQAMNSAISAAAKRYRYTGVERDDESGLEYHSARYYLPWLGRWLSADPIGLKGGINLYAYCNNRVVIGSDPSGNVIIIWVVIATAAFLLMDDAQPANAPGFTVYKMSKEESAEFIKAIRDDGARRKARDHPIIEIIEPGKTYPRHSDADMVVKGGIMIISAGAGAGVTAFAEKVVGQGIIANVAGGAVFGGVNSTGNLGYEDAKRGHLSSAKAYLITAGTGAAIGGGAAAVGTVGGNLLKRLQAGARGEPLPEDGPIPQGSEPAAKPAGRPHPKPPAKNSPYAIGARRSLVIKASDDQGMADLANRLNAKLVGRLEGQNLSEVDEITIKGHSDGDTIEIDGQKYGPTRLAKKLVDQNFKGGTVRLVSCNVGSCVGAGPTFIKEMSDELNRLLKPINGVAAVGGGDGLAAVVGGPGLNAGLPVLTKPGVNPFAPLIPEDFLEIGEGWIWE